MPTRAIVFFVLAAVTTLVGVRNVMNAAEGGNPNYNAGYFVGSFLLPVIFLIAGIASIRKSDDQ